MVMSHKSFAGLTRSANKLLATDLAVFVFIKAFEPLCEVRFSGQSALVLFQRQVFVLIRVPAIERDVAIKLAFLVGWLR